MNIVLVNRPEISGKPRGRRKYATPEEAREAARRLELAWHRAHPRARVSDASVLMSEADNPRWPSKRVIVNREARHLQVLADALGKTPEQLMREGEGQEQKTT